MPLSYSSDPSLLSFEERPPPLLATTEPEAAARCLEFLSTMAKHSSRAIGCGLLEKTSVGALKLAPLAMEMMRAFDIDKDAAVAAASSAESFTPEPKDALAPLMSSSALDSSTAVVAFDAALPGMSARVPAPLRGTGVSRGNVTAGRGAGVSTPTDEAAACDENEEVEEDAGTASDALRTAAVVAEDDEDEDENDDGGGVDESDEIFAGQGKGGASAYEVVVWLGYSSAMHATSARLANGQDDTREEAREYAAVASLPLALEVEEGASGVAYTGCAPPPAVECTAAAPPCSNDNVEVKDDDDDDDECDGAPGASIVVVVVEEGAAIDGEGASDDDDDDDEVSTGEGVCRMRLRT